MTWRQNLRPASFRGVGFHVEDRDLSGGRRIKNHEYPKRDINFPEDMGLKTRELSPSAYLIGDDYASRRDQLVAALEREGPGSYVDHWGRSQRVVVLDFSLSESRDEGRMCRIDIVFLNAGAVLYPAAVPATAVQLVTAAGGLMRAARDAFADQYRR